MITTNLNPLLFFSFDFVKVMSDDHRKSYLPQMPSELLIRPDIITLIALELDKSQACKYLM